jgi:hypothetical protein
VKELDLPFQHGRLRVFVVDDGDGTGAEARCEVQLRSNGEHGSGGKAPAHAPRREPDAMTRSQITAEQQDHLQRFAEQEGRLWKARLRESWMRGQQPNLGSETSVVLYALRNSHGPSWLADFKLIGPATVMP